MKFEPIRVNLEHLLPHRPPALLVTEVLEQTEEAATVKGRIPVDHPWAADGRVPALLLVDLAAQAAGILVGLRKVSRTRDRKAPDQGFLVSLHETRLHVTDIEAEQPLEARVCLESEMGGLAMVSFSVTCDNQTAARGRLGVFSPLQEEN